MTAQSDEELVEEWITLGFACRINDPMNLAERLTLARNRITFLRRHVIDRPSLDDRYREAARLLGLGIDWGPGKMLKTVESLLEGNLVRAYGLVMEDIGS